MRKIIYLSLLSLFMFYSCSNEEIISEENLSKNDSEVISYEEFLKMGMDSYKNDSLFIKYIQNKEEVNGNKYENKLRSYSEVTVYGYSSIKPRAGMGNKKVMFPTSEAKKYGLVGYSTYIVDFCEAEIRVPLPSNVYKIFEEDSPNCGFHPAISGKKGYINYRDGNYFVMKTNITHVKYDVSGRRVDVFAPFHANSIEWKYGIITK